MFERFTEVCGSREFGLSACTEHSQQCRSLFGCCLVLHWRTVNPAWLVPAIGARVVVINWVRMRKATSEIIAHAEKHQSRWISSVVTIHNIFWCLWEDRDIFRWPPGNWILGWEHTPSDAVTSDATIASLHWVSIYVAPTAPRGVKRCNSSLHTNPMGRHDSTTQQHDGTVRHPSVCLHPKPWKGFGQGEVEKCLFSSSPGSAWFVGHCQSASSRYILWMPCMRQRRERHREESCPVLCLPLLNLFCERQCGEIQSGTVTKSSILRLVKKSPPPSGLMGGVTPPPTPNITIKSRFCPFCAADDSGSFCSIVRKLQ